MTTPRTGLRACAACLLALATAMAAPGAQAALPPQAAPSLDDKDGHPIPFSYDPLLLPYIVVQVQLNDGEAMPFVLDTGCSLPMLVRPWAADKLGLKPTGQTVEAVPGPMVLVEVALRRSVLVGTEGPADLGLDAAYVADLGDDMDSAYAGSRIAGLIGMPILGEVTVRFDFPARRMMVFPQAHPPLQIVGAAALPLHADAWTPSVRVAPLQDIPLDLELDTGSLETSLRSDDLDRARPAPLRKVLVMQADQTVQIADEALIPRFQLGSLQESDVVVDEEAGSRPAALGLRLLSRFRVTLDSRHGQLILERPEGGVRQPDVPGASGANLVLGGQGFVVDQLDAASPAAHAGLRRDDRVLSIDGQPLSGLPYPVARRVLNGVAGTRATLDVERRGGKRALVVFTRGSAYPADGCALAGLVLVRKRGGVLRVTRVAKGAPAEKAGLAPGDEVVSLGGALGATLPPQEFAWLTNRADVRLQTRREADGKPREVQLRRQRTLGGPPPLRQPEVQKGDAPAGTAAAPPSVLCSSAR